MSAQKHIVIKQVKKKKAGGHHGGSWKVAYADFVTGMMAFFLLLWLLSMTATEKRARVATYFKHFSIFQESGTSFMADEDAILTEAGGEVSIRKERDFKKDKGDYEEIVITPEQLHEKLLGEIKSKLEGLEDHVMIEVFSGGVRIQLLDKAGQPLFPLGGSSPNPLGQKMLKAVAETIRDLPNKISIEGHTDAISYATTKYTNWELSTERASSARRELELHGLDPDRLAQVAGYAATQPLIKDNPNDPRNRRISIIIQYSGNREKDIVNTSVLNPSDRS